MKNVRELFLPSEIHSASIYTIIYYVLNRAHFWIKVIYKEQHLHIFRMRLKFNCSNDELFSILFFFLWNAKNNMLSEIFRKCFLHKTKQNKTKNPMKRNISTIFKILLTFFFSKNFWWILRILELVLVICFHIHPLLFMRQKISLLFFRFLFFSHFIKFH